MNSVEVNTTRLAEFFHLTVQQINNYHHDGMPKLGRGRFDLNACWEWRWNRLSEAHERLKSRPEMLLDKDLEDAQLKQVTRFLKEEELAKVRKETLNMEDAKKAIEHGVMAYRSKTLALPTTLAPRMIGITDANEAKVLLESYVHEALSELARIPDDIDAVASGEGTILSHDAPSDAPATPDGEPVGRSGKVSKPRGKRRTRKVAHGPRRVSTGDS